jgi:hypothetical protein
MVLYSADEFESDREEVLNFWCRILHSHCRRKNTLVIQTQCLIRDYTLYDIVPTSFELSIPQLLTDARVLSVSELQDDFTGHQNTLKKKNISLSSSPAPAPAQTQSQTPSSNATESISQLLSRYMSSSFALTTHTTPQQQQTALISRGIMCTPLLVSLERHIVMYTTTLPLKERVLFLPSAYKGSSLAQYMLRAGGGMQVSHVVGCGVV